MRIKISDIIFIIVVVLFTVTIIKFDEDAPFKPLYWLIAKLAGVTIILFWVAISRFKSVKESRMSYILSISVSILSIGYFAGYKEIARYNRDIRQEKFGLVLNKNRQKLGVPIIPDNWKMRYHFSDREFTWWKGAKDTIGHLSKDIDLDSLSRIIREDDSYHFYPKKDTSRDLLISTYYSHKNDLDSIIYYFENGNNSRKITRQQADSLFAAEKIAKDY
ncbi:MAG: hypothetical protein ACTHNW_05205 [Mucilaginibacter sp.]